MPKEVKAHYAVCAQAKGRCKVRTGPICERKGDALTLVRLEHEVTCLRCLAIMVRDGLAFQSDLLRVRYPNNPTWRKFSHDR